MEFSSKVLVSKCTKVGPASTQVCLTFASRLVRKKKKYTGLTRELLCVINVCFSSRLIRPKPVHNIREKHKVHREKISGLYGFTYRAASLFHLSVHPTPSPSPSRSEFHLLPSSTPENRGRDRETIFRVSNYNFPKAHCLAFIHAARDIERGGREK